MEKDTQEPLLRNDDKKEFDIMKKNPKIKEQGGFVKIEDRSMTDVWGKILFIPTMIIFAYVGLDGYFNGNITKLTAPYDGAGNFCGVGDMEGFPFLLVDFESLDAWSPPSPADVFKKTVCVKECPSNLKEGEAYNAKVDCKTNDVITTCPTKKFLS